MGRQCALVLLAVGLLMLGGTSLASAQKWAQITGTDQGNTSEVSLARTSDGVLHVAWSRPDPAHPKSKEDLLDRHISAGGAVGSQGVIEADWVNLQNPALVSTGSDGLDLFVGATRSLNHSETISNLAFLTSSNGGGKWTLQPDDVTKTDAPYSADVTAAVAGGTPFEAWGSSDCLCVHRGTTTATPNNDFQKGLGHFGYEPGMARDPKTGHLEVAWYSNGSGHKGVYAAKVDQSTGAISGSAMQMPDTSNLADGPFNGRTQIVGRPGGGLYVVYEGGYPAHTKMLLWRVGSASSMVMAQDKSGVESVGVTSTPTGRLWVFWEATTFSGSPMIHARRSDTSGKHWGATVNVKPPKNTSTIWNMVGNGQAGPLDLFASVTIGVASHAATWYTQLLPGLTLQASQTHLSTHTAHAQKVTFTVLDAGVPVKGAAVHVGKVSGTTDKSGKVTLALGPFNHKTHLKARASAGGYTGASLTLKVS